MTGTAAAPLTIAVSDRIVVSGIARVPRSATTGFVFAHGAGAGMRHPFMENMAERLAAREVATLRYQFPYTEAGRSRPDARAVLLDTVRAAVRDAATVLSGLPLFAGGKSMGGRMTSLASAEAGLAGIRGLAFLGFPLHPAGRPGLERADHLVSVLLPMLFLQGTRDSLADLALLRPVCARLGALATLHEIDGADHGFHVPRRSGRSNDEVLDHLAETMAGWMTRHSA